MISQTICLFIILGLVYNSCMFSTLNLLEKWVDLLLVDLYFKNFLMFKNFNVYYLSFSISITHVVMCMFLIIVKINEYIFLMFHVFNYKLLCFMNYVFNVILLQKTMVHEVDPVWRHGVDVDGQKSKIKCNYCNNMITGGITRLKQNLVHREARVTKCHKVSPELKKKMQKKEKKMQALLDAGKQKKIVPQKRKQAEYTWSMQRGGVWTQGAA